MRDLGNFKTSGEYVITGLNSSDVDLFMDTWLARFQSLCKEHNHHVLLMKEDCKLPNTAREMGGVIGLIGKMASSTVKGYNIKDNSGGKGKALYDVYLVPRDTQGGTVVEAYIITWYGISLKNSEKIMGESLLQNTSQLLNNSFNDVFNK